MRNSQIAIIKNLNGMNRGVDYLLCIQHVWKKTCYFLNSFVKLWPILIFFGMQRRKET